MKSQRHILITNSVSKTGIEIPTKCLCDEFVRMGGIAMPQYISHDRLRLQGIVVPTNLYFHSGLSFIIGHVHEPENQDDYALISQVANGSIHQMVHSFPQEDLDQLWAKTPDLPNKKYIATCCPACHADNLAKTMFPELFEKEDKDGLININLAILNRYHKLCL